VFPWPSNSPATWFGLAPFLARERFDLLHSPFAVAPLNLRRPLVVTIHDLMWIVNPRFNSNSAICRLLVGAFYRRSLESVLHVAGRLVAPSEATRRAIVDHAPWHAGKTRVALLGVDAGSTLPGDQAGAQERVRQLLAPGTPFVLTVGDASPHKNHANALRGFLLAFGHRPEYRMVLVRRFVRRDRAMADLLARPEVRAQVITLPHVPGDLLRSLYQTARIYLHPSYYEGFGLPLLEAMAAGTPVVTSRTSCLPEVAGPAALQVDPADPVAIGAALTRLDQDAELRERLVVEGRRRATSFSWQQCARSTLEAYRELL
jgi:glycosyltransferase involved in cell wall biosynthesis